MRRLIQWVRRDGGLHILLSFIIVLFVSVISTSWWIGVVFGVICGNMKEVGGIIISLVEHRGIDWKDIIHDLICDLFGIGVAICCYFMYFYIVF